LQGGGSFAPGFELGSTDSEGNFYIFNHLMFNVLVRKVNREKTGALHHSKRLMMDATTQALPQERSYDDDSTPSPPNQGSAISWLKGIFRNAPRGDNVQVTEGSEGDGHKRDQVARDKKIEKNQKEGGQRQEEEASDSVRGLSALLCTSPFISFVVLFEGHC
jgi:hypothetical protein